jgi:hypothetical protein
LIKICVETLSCSKRNEEEAKVVVAVELVGLFGCGMVCGMTQVLKGEGGELSQ